MKKRIFTRSNLQLYSLSAIPLALVFIFNYLPMFGIIIAFKDYRYDKGILDSDWVGFKNFEYFFRSNDFWIITRNTLFLNMLFILTGIFFALVLAIAFFEVNKSKNVKVYQTIAITPNFLSWVVVGYMAYALFNPEFGFINGILKGFDLKGVQWYSEAKAWPAILTVFSAWKNMGIDSILYYASLMSINSELFEAAEIDGAGKFQQIIKITIPSLIPIITILGILKIGGIFHADFGLFYQLTRNVGSLYETTDVIDTYVYRTLRVIGDMSMSSAAGVLQSVVGFIMVVTTNAVVKRVDPERALF